MGNRKEILCVLNSIIEETTQYDFPFLANEKRKEEIINKKKYVIEERLKYLDLQAWPSEAVRNQIWHEAIGYTNSRFGSVPVKLQINGFYLQELMHFYSEKLGNVILSQLEEV